MARVYQGLTIRKATHKYPKKNGKPRAVARKVTMRKRITVRKNGKKTTTRKYYSGKPSRAPSFNNWW
jgi:hypothetical protein